MPLISVVIPAHNVERYLDQCLASVTGQTCPDLEIMLINDGSTDNTGKKCEEWAAKDSRIRYFDKCNEGLGATRNMGVDMSCGEYVAFVDSDDWVAPEYLEKMHNALCVTRSDISVCDRYTYDDANGSLKLIRNGLCGDSFEVRQVKSVIYNTFHNAWGKLFSRRFLVENSLRHPTGLYEDGIIPVWLAVCGRMAYVREPLYYYRLFRPGAITGSADNLPAMRNHFLLVRDEFRKRGLFDDFRAEIMVFFERRILSHLGFAKQVFEREERGKKKRDEEAYNLIRRDFLELYAKSFGDEAATAFLSLKPGACVAFGSYNLGRAAQRYSGGSHEGLVQHYCFSGVASAMSRFDPELNALPIRHPVQFREKHVIYDLNKSFAHKNRKEIEGIDCFLLDFLEERFPLGRYGDTYLTISDAFKNAVDQKAVTYVSLSRGEEETERIWRKKCLELIRMLESVYRGKLVILVQMKLAEFYGAFGRDKAFDNIEEIRKVNRFLDSCYTFFLQNCPWCIALDVENEEYFYTDSCFSHGCFPWHLNETAYMEIGKKIRRAVIGGLT